MPTWLSRLYWSGILPVLFVALAIASSFGIALVFTVLFILASMGTGRWQVAMFYKVLFAADQISVQTLPTTATLSEEGARFENDAGYLFYRWQFIREVSRAGRYVRFIVDPTERVHIPLAAFHDDAHVGEFLAFAASRVKSRHA